MGAEEAERWGFFNRLADDVVDEAVELAASLASGPTFAHSMTKTMLDQEWDMSLPAAIEAEAQAQAICMQTQDFERAYERVPGQGAAGLRGRLNARVAVLRGSSPRVRRRSRRACRRSRRPSSTRAAGRSCAGWRDDGWLAALRSRQPLDVRTLCLARETLAYHDALADFAFAMQGLGRGPITLFGDDALRERTCRRWPPARRSRRSRSPSRRPAPTSRR